MRLKKIINLAIIIICVCLITCVGVFINNATNRYKISKDFVSVPLQFNPDDSSSTYQMKNSQITVFGGFVKSIQKVVSTI